VDFPAQQLVQDWQAVRRREWAAQEGGARGKVRHSGRALLAD